MVMPNQNRSKTPFHQTSYLSKKRALSFTDLDKAVKVVMISIRRNVLVS